MCRLHAVFAVLTEIWGWSVRSSITRNTTYNDVQMLLPLVSLLAASVLGGWQFKHVELSASVRLFASRVCCRCGQGRKTLEQVSGWSRARTRALVVRMVAREQEQQCQWCVQRGVGRC